MERQAPKIGDLGWKKLHINSDKANWLGKRADLVSIHMLINVFADILYFGFFESKQELVGKLSSIEND